MTTNDDWEHRLGCAKNLIATRLEHGKPNLATLPEDVLRRILDFLLTARDIKKISLSSSKELHWYRTTIFDFHTAILRVNKSIHKLALENFISNHFILVSSKTIFLLKLLEHNQIQTWSTKTFKQFKHYRMHVMLNVGKENKYVANYRGPPTSFLICMEQLKTFVLILRRWTANFRGCYEFLFDLKAAQSGDSMSFKHQSELLDPFMKLQGGAQTCKIVGKVDAKLAQYVMNAMMPRFFWFRARLREMYDILAAMKAVADQAFDDGEMEVAFRLYEDAASSIAIMQRTDTWLSLVERDDKTFWNNLHALIIALHFNLMTAALLQVQHEPDYDKRKERLGEVLRYSTEIDRAYTVTLGAHHHAGMWYCYLVAAVAIHDVNKTMWLLENSKADHVAVAHHFQQGVDIARSWADHSSTTITTKKKKRLDTTSLAKMFDVLPRKSIQPVIYTKTSISASIEFERYILNKMDYHGDLYEDRIVQKEGYRTKLTNAGAVEVQEPFDPQLSDMFIMNFERELVRQNEMGWVPEIELKSVFKPRPNAARMREMESFFQGAMFQVPS